MIKKLIIENFKSHEHTEIELSPFMNVIYGKPDIGKSNVIKAIRLLKDNKPLGGKIMPNFLKKKCHTVVQAELEDGTKVKVARDIRITVKGDKHVDKSEYQIDDNEPYTGFNKSVPDKVIETLNLNELNVQRQGDNPYLIGDSGGEFSRTINRLTGIGEANDWLYEINKKVSEYTIWLANKDSDITELNDTISRYQRLGHYESKINDLTTKERCAINKRSTLKKVEELQAIVLKYKEKADILGRCTQHVVNLDEKTTTYSMLSQTIKKIKNVKLLLSDLKIKKQLYPKKNIIDLYESTKNKLLELSKKKFLIKKILNLKNTIIETEQKEKNTRTEYINLLIENKKCPTCLTDIDENKINLIGELL